MIIVIGKDKCAKCEMTKNILKNKGIDFEYMLLNDVSNADDRRLYASMIRNNDGMMPLIIKDGKEIILSEVCS